jgi:hypothetical protein
MGALGNLIAGSLVNGPNGFALRAAKTYSHSNERPEEQGYPNAPHMLTLLRARRERPGSRATHSCSNRFRVIIQPNCEAFGGSL